MVPLDVPKGSNYGCVIGELLGNGQLRMQPQIRGQGATMICRVDKGNALLPAILVILAVAAIVIVSVSTTVNYLGQVVDGVKPIPGDACPCNTETDRQEMEQRLAEAEALAKKVNDDLVSNGSSSKPASKSEKEGSLPQLQEAIGGEVNKVAGTKPTCATWTSEDKPACTRWALQTHENVHSAACQKFAGSSGKGNWIAAGTMEAYWREDAGAYQAEIDFLKSKLAKCPPQQTTYIGPETKEEQQQRLAGSKRRVQKAVGLPS